MKIYLYPYVFCQFVPIPEEHLTRSRCKSDPIMAGVSPPERALYNQKIILLFPTVPVILSSNKQTNSLGWRRDTQHTDSWKNTRVLHCRHDCAHRTRVWIRLFSLFPHTLSPTHTGTKYTVRTHRTGHTIRVPLPAALSACYSVLYHGGVGALSRWLRPLPVHYRHRHTIWALCSGAPAKWASVKIERAQMDREPCHISLCTSRLWNDKMARICNKASGGHRPDGHWCQLSYVNSDLIFLSLIFSHTVNYQGVISLPFFCLCTSLSLLLCLSILPFLYLWAIQWSGRLCLQFKERRRKLW